MRHVVVVESKLQGHAGSSEKKKDKQNKAEKPTETKQEYRLQQEQQSFKIQIVASEFGDEAVLPARCLVIISCGGWTPSVMAQFVGALRFSPLAAMANDVASDLTVDEINTGTDILLGGVIALCTSLITHEDQLDQQASSTTSVSMRSLWIVAKPSNDPSSECVVKQGDMSAVVADSLSSPVMLSGVVETGLLDTSWIDDGG